MNSWEEGRNKFPVLNRLYQKQVDYYNSKVITDIIYNENSNLVSVFKDYLIYDDVSEFLKRTYNTDESKERLPKVFEFYEKIFKKNKYMFKNIERKQRMIDDKQNALDNIEQRQRKKNNGHFSDLLGDSSIEMFSTKFMDSILKQDEELEKQRKQREINQKFVKAVEDFTKNDSIMGPVDQSQVSVNLSMSEMDNKENSDLSLIKSEFTVDQNESHHSNISNKQQVQTTPAGKNKPPNPRKVNVFEYNNLANKKIKLINLNKPLQRTDIIHLESSLDLDKSSPVRNKKKAGKSSVLSSQKFLKNSQNPISKISKKVSLKSLKMSENDDRRTFISSTDRHLDMTSNKQRNSEKTTEPGIIITKRSEVPRMVKKRKKIVMDQKLTTRNNLADKLISHQRKNTDIWTNQMLNGGDSRQSFLTKQAQGNSSHPLLVMNGMNTAHKHTKSKDVLLTGDKRLGKPNSMKSQKSYKNIYSKPMHLNTRSKNSSSKKRRKGRGFQSQHHGQLSIPTQTKGNLYVGPTTGGNSSVKRKNRDTSSQKFSTVSTSKFNTDSLGLTLVQQKEGAKFKDKKLNERNFKNHIVTERYKNSDGSHPRFGSKERKSTNLGSKQLKSIKIRGASSSAIGNLPTSVNNNHHYGLFFNTNNTERQSKELLLNDKKMKSMKHFKKSQIHKEKQKYKIEGLGKYYGSLTERNQKRAYH